MGKLSTLKIEEYKKTTWKDNLVQYGNRFEKEDLENGIIKLKKYEGEIYQVGTTVEEITMNNMEKGIYNNNKYILAIVDDVKAQQLQINILQASLTGNVSGDVYVDDLENLDSIELSRGIYDKKEKEIYCVDK